MSVRHVLPSNSRSYIRHCSGALGLDVTAISPWAELLASCIPHIELNRHSVGVKREGMDFDHQGGYRLLTFTT